MFTASRTYIVDIVALDASDQQVLYAEIKTNPANRETGLIYLEDLLKNVAPPSVKFGALVTSQEIEFFEWNGFLLSSVLVVPTQEVFAFYDPEVKSEEIHEIYTSRLFEGWLRDLAYGWKSTKPPFQAELVKIGLAELLKDGTTRAEERLEAE